MSNTIITARVTYVLVGYGDLTLTDEAIYWNKSGTSYLAFGAANALTDNHVFISLPDIDKVEKYTYFPGGGLAITDSKGKLYKFSFKHKKDFKVFYDHLIGGR